FLLFFFSSRRRHTRFSRDWSSDVCSSDLEDGFANLLETFLQDSSAKLQGLREALAAEDADGLRRNAHSLKGSSSNLGALQLADLSREVEQLAREGQIDGIGELLAQLDTEYQAVAAVMQERLAQL